MMKSSISFIRVVQILSVLALMAIHLTDGQPNMAAANEMKELTEKAYLACKSELGLKEGDVKKYMMSLQKDGGGDGCGLACLGDKVGIMVNGKMNEPKIMDLVHKVLPSGSVTEMVQGVVHQCAESSNKEQDKCKVMLNFAKCGMTKAKEMKGNNRGKQ